MKDHQHCYGGRRELRMDANAMLQATGLNELLKAAPRKPMRAKRHWIWRPVKYGAMPVVRHTCCFTYWSKTKCKNYIFWFKSWGKSQLWSWEAKLRDIKLVIHTAQLKVLVTNIRFNIYILVSFLVNTLHCAFTHLVYVWHETIISQVIIIIWRLWIALIIPFKNVSIIFKLRQDGGGGVTSFWDFFTKWYLYKYLKDLDLLANQFSARTSN